MLKEAKYQEPLKDGKIICGLCPHNCKISDSKEGMCRARINKNGKLFTKNYGIISSAGMDPVEKKPLYHFLPKGWAYSIGTFGCNLKCRFCQNWKISQSSVSEEFKDTDLVQTGYKIKTPEEVVSDAADVNSDCIAFTYNEPTIWYEFVYDTALLAKKQGLKTVLVTNGYINEKPLEELLKYIDACALDIKGFTERFYNIWTGGKLNPVLQRARQIYKSGCHIEIVFLAIPGINDDKESTERMFEWIRQNLSTETPIHINAYHPDYKMTAEKYKLPCSNTLISIANEARKKGLSHVYIGNVKKISTEYTDTRCPICGNVWIRRDRYDTQIMKTKDPDRKKMICPVCFYESKTIVF